MLTLSTGLISINSPLSSANAQNSALSQKGNGNDEEDTAQSQVSYQDNQVVSGEENSLSGNNLSCQSMDNSQEIKENDKICSLEGGEFGNHFPNSDQIGLVVNFIARGVVSSDHVNIIIKNIGDGSLLDKFRMGDEEVKTKTYTVPFGNTYSIVEEMHPGDPDITNIRGCPVGPSPGECKFVTDNNPKLVSVLISQIH